LQEQIIIFLLPEKHFWDFCF